MLQSDWVNGALTLMATTMTDEIDPDIVAARNWRDSLGAPLEPKGISAEAIERWTAISNDASVVLPLSKQDIDELYFCLQALLGSSISNQQALRLWTNGKLEGANAYFDAATTYQVNATARLSRFMEAIMRKAEVDVD